MDMDDGVEGAVPGVDDDVVLGCTRYRRGEEGRRVRTKPPLLGGRPRMGEGLLSVARGVWSRGTASPASRISFRAREGRAGKTSSTGFLGVRRLGEPMGLEGR
jgi:hypothetical protein